LYRKGGYAMGDKGKKDKEKGRKQKINKQGQKAKKKLEKQQKGPLVGMQIAK
jgi:hypothetical protein